MSDSHAATTPSGQERIDLADEGSVARWTRKLDATAEQIREAVGAVGDGAADVEMHLKGSHSTTNSDRVADAS